ncbi:serine/threonine-protein kinase [Streptomyces sp. NPDC006274]|uniref:serine/threonine-protein kinase n=1 Tax=unclassified Streptomyces TaxID=2593676 RepID=UPI0033A6174E
MSDQRPAPPYSPASGDAALAQAGATPLGPADPAIIGPYVPLGLLGSGGMGRVYLARPADDSPGLAAVKVIRPEYAEDAEFRRRFEREAAVHARVGAPHAPALLGTAFQDTLLWMGTQYLPGLNLADAVRDCGALTPAAVWRLIAELGRALEALAAVGVVHRDLKPSNVILSLRGAHVIDFGISQAADSSAITTTGSRVGTPAFMAPEYLRDGRCDAASDVFSLAGTIVYAATGHAPFGDGTGVDVMHRVAFEEPRAEVMGALGAADPALAALLTACLSKDPAGRPTPPQLVEAAAGHPCAPAWEEPLASRLLARQQGCAVLEHAPARQTGHFRAPTQQVAAPAAGPAFGAPTPPGAYGPPTPVPYRSAPCTPVPVPGVVPAARRRGRKLYLAVGSGLAVCAVALGVFLLTRPAGTDSAALSPTAVDSSGPGGDPAVPRPGVTDASPSAGEDRDDEKDKDKKDKDEDARDKPDDSAGTDRGGAEDAPAPSAATTPDSGGGTVPSSAPPAPSPARTTAEPATPAWLSQCTYYSGTAITRYGDKGQRVVQVQCMLSERGYSVGRAGVDGEFGEDTAAAVKRFQSDKGLLVDGEVGPDTWGALRKRT